MGCKPKQSHGWIKPASIGGVFRASVLLPQMHKGARDLDESFEEAAHWITSSGGSKAFKPETFQNFVGFEVALFVKKFEKPEIPRIALAGRDFHHRLAQFRFFHSVARKAL